MMQQPLNDHLVRLFQVTMKTDLKRGGRCAGCQIFINFKHKLL